MSTVAGLTTGAASLTEREWSAQVVELARTLGWRHVYHTFDSRRSSRGFPDLVLVRERVVWLELKREDRRAGRLTEQQREWLLALRYAGAEAYVVRPSDLDDLGRVLAGWQPWSDVQAAPAAQAARRLTGRTLAEAGV